MYDHDDCIGGELLGHDAEDEAKLRQMERDEARTRTASRKAGRCTCERPWQHYRDAQGWINCGNCGCRVG